MPNALSTAIDNQNLDNVKAALDNGCEINEEIDEFTALERASICSRSSMAIF